MRVILCLLLVTLASCGGKQPRVERDDERASVSDDAEADSGFASFEKALNPPRQPMTLMELFQSLDLMKDWSAGFAEGYDVPEAEVNLREADLSYDLDNHKWLKKLIVTVEAIPAEGAETFNPAVPHARVKVIEMILSGGKHHSFRHDSTR